jgi:hypothetical protein
MAPILGIWASQISGRLWEPQGAFDALSTVTVPSGGLASIDFAGIPQGYEHLQIRATTRATSSGANTLVRLNGDAGANYSFHALYGDGSSAAASSGASQSSALVGYTANSTTPANIFSVLVLDILDYNSASKNKTLRSLDGFDSNNASFNVVQFNSSAWYSTAAINSVSLIMNSGNFAQHSTFTLYGVR